MAFHLRVTLYHILNYVCSYSDVFACFILVVDAIDSALRMGEQVTKRMIKKVANEANPPEPKIPKVLKKCQNSGKRFRDVEGNIKMTFMPEWGICEQDSVIKSSLLAID